MNVIPPITITEGILTSSTIAEPSTGEVAWVSGTTYAVGDVRILTSTHRKYQRLTAGAGTTAPNLDTTNWIDIGPTNKWAMFDVLRNSASTDTTPITVVLTPGQLCNSVAILQSNAQNITITGYSPIAGTTVYSNTISTRARNTTGWYDYYFEELYYRANTIVFDIPLYKDIIITITMSGDTTVTCGAIVIGKYASLGHVQPGATVEALNFSLIERDDFGNVTLIQRRSVPKTNQTLYTPIENIDAIRTIRNSLNALPAVWSGHNSNYSDNYFDALLILGFYRNFTISAETPMYAKIELELEEI